MTGCRTLTAPGTDAGHAQRRAAFEQARPDAVLTRWPGQWTGSLTVCRKRLEITRPVLGQLLDELDALAALDDDARAVESEFAGWRLWLSSVNRWWATRQGPDATWTRSVGVPITVSADDLAGLRAQLADARAAAEAAEAAGGTA